MSPHLAALADDVIATLRTFVTRRVDPLTERIAELERRLAALEQRKSLDYRGVWDQAQPYAPGDAVTRQGSLFVCKERTDPEDVPGHSDRWQLAVKRGRVE